MSVPEVIFGIAVAVCVMLSALFGALAWESVTKIKYDYEKERIRVQTESNERVQKLCIMRNTEGSTDT